MSSDFNNRILVVGELRRSSIWIELDVGRNKLKSFSIRLCCEVWTLTCADTKMGSGPASAKKPTWLTEVTMASTCRNVRPAFQTSLASCSYGLTLKGSPYNSAVSNSKLSQATAGQDATFGDVKGIHDGDDEVSASACTLDVLQQLSCDQLVHVPTEVGRVQRDLSLEIVEEEHLDILRGSRCREKCVGRGIAALKLRCAWYLLRKICELEGAKVEGRYGSCSRVVECSSIRVEDKRECTVSRAWN